MNPSESPSEIKDEKIDLQKELQDSQQIIINLRKELEHKDKLLSEFKAKCKVCIRKKNKRIKSLEEKLNEHPISQNITNSNCGNTITTNTTIGTNNITFAPTYVTTINIIHPSSFTPITQESFNENVDKLTVEHLAEGVKGYARWLTEGVLKDNVNCSSVKPRRITYPKDSNPKPFIDDNCDHILRVSFDSAKFKQTKLFLQLMQDKKIELSSKEPGEEADKISRDIRMYNNDRFSIREILNNTLDKGSKNPHSFRNSLIRYVIEYACSLTEKYKSLTSLRQEIN